jgi:hypothetical protein
MRNIKKKSSYVLAIAAAIVILIIILVPEGFLGCKDGFAERSPDGHWTLNLCRRPMLFAMPGQGSDAPAWIVLRDQFGAIRGVSSLGMIQSYSAASGLPTEWTQTKVERLLVVEFPLVSAPHAFARWLDDRFWRIKAWLGLTTSDADFH